MKTWKKLVGVTATVAILASLTATAVTFAQAPEQSPAIVEGEALGNGPGPRHGPFGGEKAGSLDQELAESMRLATDEAVAEALGMTTDELQAAHEAGQRIPDLADEKGVDMADIQAAMDDARDVVLDQAVADGTLTQEQADAVKNRGGRGFGPGPEDGGRFGPLDSALAESMRQATDEATAEVLGMTVDELQAAREAGQRIHDLADEKGVDMDEIQSAVEAARNAVLDEAVADGTLAQEQADALSQGPHGPMGEGGPGHGPRDGGRQPGE